MSQPNILHLFTDQQRFDSIAALGNPYAQTPYLDRMVREGTSFTSAYTPCAECVPARASMITGKYADKTNCGSNADFMPPEDHPTLMSLLVDSGYHTHGVGKCHFTPDPWAMRGFLSRDTSEEIAEHPGGDAYLAWLIERGFDHVMEPHGVRGEMYYIPQPSQLPAEAHPTQWVADRCRDFVRKQPKGGSPWYLYGGFIHPHPPFAPPNPWHKLFRGPDMPIPFLPENCDELTCFVNKFQNRYKYRDHGLDINLVRCIRAYYHACISFIDHQVGRILKELEAAGELENTLIVFTSDHGELLGDFGSFGKRSFHDASQRVPMIVRYPKAFKADNICSSPVSLVDLLPTFLSVANAPAPEEADGMSLIDIAEGRVDRECVFFHYNRGEDAVLGAISEDWKYAWSVPDQQEYLFDRKIFPEKSNHAKDANAGHEVSAMRHIVQMRANKHDFSRVLLDDQCRWREFAKKSLPDDPDEGLIFQDPPHARPELPTGYNLEYPR